jgi:hypothetical protein
MLKSLDSLSDSEDSIKSVKQKKKAPESPPPSLLLPPPPPSTVKKEVKILKQDNTDQDVSIENVIQKPLKKTISVQAPDVGIPIEKRTLNTKFKRIVCISDTHCKHDQFLSQGLIPDGDIL